MRKYNPDYILGRMIGHTFYDDFGDLDNDKITEIKIGNKYTVIKFTNGQVMRFTGEDITNENK